MIGAFSSARFQGLLFRMLSRLNNLDSNLRHEEDFKCLNSELVF
jgi:hypothetical protein